VHGPKKNRAVRIALDLLAQFGNAVVDRAMAGALPFWPKGADKPVP
jgi:hypothetical protein